MLLPGVKSIPNDLLFLRQLHQVTFKDDVGEEDALDNLEWAITGKHPKRSRERPAAESDPTGCPFTGQDPWPVRRR